ncbi:hypothetical protein EVAR_73039_1 [Eumeta japonica]|uniref:Uncharacterized protein n=1 Tax=Eumeta variegata TaxID=151549 RepID=A0A4C1T4B9_EUMVA|nr:hypothetical protein EVAR_73039_1 [Eumeta japonica]
MVNCAEERLAPLRLATAIVPLARTHAVPTYPPAIHAAACLFDGGRRSVGRSNQTSTPADSGIVPVTLRLIAIQPARTEYSAVKTLRLPTT